MRSLSAEVEADEVVAAHITWWQRRGTTPRKACRALGIRPRIYGWSEVRAYMIRWWLRNHDAA